MWVPLVVLAILAVIGGSRLLSISLLLENSVKEGTTYCRMTDPSFNGFGSAWPADAPDATGALTVSQQAHLHGAGLVGQYVSWAFLVGIVGGFLCYARGYGVSMMLLKIAPVRWVHTWLYRRMYFDELYFNAYEATISGLGMLCALYDRDVIDGVVTGVATLARGLAIAARSIDKYVFDGAVNGAASFSQEMGAMVRAPQTGRIRLYVMLLMAAVTAGLAGAVILAMR